MILVSHEGSNIWVHLIEINFSKIGKKKQTNVGYFVTDEINNGNFKNTGNIAKKKAVSGFDWQSKVN